MGGNRNENDLMSWQKSNLEKMMKVSKLCSNFAPEDLQFPGYAERVPG